MGTPVSAGSTFQNAADDYTLTVPATAGGAIIAAQGGLTVSQVLVGAAAVPAVVSGSTATFANVAAGVTAKLRATPSAVEVTYTLASAAAPRSYASTMTLSPGYTLQAAGDGSLAILAPDGSVAGSVPAPVLRDSSNSVDYGTSTAAHYVLAGVGPVYTVATVIDGGWIDDPARVFPVTLDPSVAFGTASDTGCYVTNPTPNPGVTGPPPDPKLCSANTGTDNALAYGSTAYVRRAYLTFGDLTAAGSPVPTDAVISNAALTMTENVAADPTRVLATQVTAVTSAWTSTGISWAPSPLSARL